MTSLIVIAFKIGWSARKVPKSVMIRIWYSFIDRTGVGLKSLINFNDGLRYSQAYYESNRIEMKQLEDGRTLADYNINFLGVCLWEP